MVEEEEKQAPTELARKQKFENLTKVLDEIITISCHRKEIVQFYTKILQKQ